MLSFQLAFSFLISVSTRFKPAKEKKILRASLTKMVYKHKAIDFSLQLEFILKKKNPQARKFILSTYYLG